MIDVTLSNTVFGKAEVKQTMGFAASASSADREGVEAFNLFWDSLRLRFGRRKLNSRLFAHCLSQFGLL